jgi:nitrate/nitrite transporter NarK
MQMLALILAGEVVFALPFHITRFFRPTVLEVFGLSNTELGQAQAAYGIVAMLAYFPGGPLADRFSARRLLSLALWTTAAGGVYMSTMPGFRGAAALWGFFGITSVMLSWAALIRATRDWGGHDAQGRAFGLLDGGRGILAAALASLGAWSFTLAFPDGYAVATFAERQQALQTIIHGYTMATLLAGFLVWFALPEHDPRAAQAAQGRRAMLVVLAKVRLVLGLPAVWLTALIVVCAYVAYKGGDNYALYAVQAFGWSETDAASLVAVGAWVRPLAALGFGLLGDRYLVSRMTVVCFAMLLVSQLLFALLTPAPGLDWVLVTNILLGSTAMFGLRALYFALLEEARVPLAVTGTAVGVISVVGFTPDIFVALVGGMLLDRSPGLVGHQHYYWFQSLFAALGVAAAGWFYVRYRPRP